MRRGRSAGADRSAAALGVTTAPLRPDDAPQPRTVQVETGSTFPLTSTSPTFTQSNASSQRARVCSATRMGTPWVLVIDSSRAARFTVSPTAVYSRRASLPMSPTTTFVLGAVIFPQNIGLGAANDPDLMERIGRVTAREVLATGVEWTFAPTLAVVRNDHWGRTYESFSEDPDIVAECGSAIVRGLQGDLWDASVIACAKHWVGDGGTRNGVDQGETTVSEEELRRLHIAPYLAALEAGALTVMASYNSWNGKKCHGHRYLLTDVLKDELGFDGFVVSDWDGTDQVAKVYEDAVAAAVNAGVDMFMVPMKWKLHLAALEGKVRAGVVPMARIDDAVRRILRVKLAYGLDTRPRPADRPFSDHPSFGSAEHREVAREAVRKSLVLLKNEGALPLDSGARILVAGKNADDRGHQCGGFTITWQGTSGPGAIVGGSSIWEGIQRVAPRAVLSPDGSADGDFDVAVVVIGETPYAEGMGDVRVGKAVAHGSGLAAPIPVAPGSGGVSDGDEPAPGPGVMRPYGTTLELSVTHPEDMAVIAALTARGIPVVTVLVSGRPLVVNDELAASTAFVAAWLPGSEGQGVADVLFGEHDFVGRLGFSWPTSNLHNPNRGDDPDTSLFPYGFGLSLRA
jgi:beta-glucosidase